MFNPSSTRLTPITREIMGLPKEDRFLLDSQEVNIARFSFSLYSEVLEHLFTSGYTRQELKNRPDYITYELLDAINQVCMYGEEINKTVFEVETKNHWRVAREIMEEVSILLED